LKRQKIPPAGSPLTGGRHERRILGRAQDEGVGDPYKLRRKLPEPTRCPACGAVYHEGRWQWMDRPPANAHEELCQACHRINEEIINLARNLEQAEKQDHPLNRIIAIDKEEPDTLVITTTDVHLPRRIGTAIHHAFQGDLKLHFDEDNYFIRVDWARET
jgi:hypothetical protein